MFANAFYRNYSYSADDNILVLYDINPICSKSKIFIVSQINKSLKSIYSYGKQYRMNGFDKTKIQLPMKNNKIDFEFMESFIAEIEQQRILELEIEHKNIINTYLSVTSLKNFELSSEETQVLEKFEKFDWKIFNLLGLYGPSTRGRRLKSSDRVPGNLPFVTAGEKNEGISAFIGNDVTIFSENTITIDMFGSAKYRNYKYGGDDHIAVVHTEKLPKFASLFVTTAIHKASYTGKFDYSRNFYAKDADELNIMLPIKNQKPDLEKMVLLISAFQKLVIKDVVLNADRKIEATKKIVNTKKSRLPW